MISVSIANAQTQKGADIDGEAGEKSGISVSMSDANTVAIGAYYNDANGPYAGGTRIYEWDGRAWNQKGSDLYGESAGDYSGRAVSMPDANTVAIGADGNDAGNRTNAGHVRIFVWNGSTWIQKGTDIDGESWFDGSGFSVSMPDPNTVAIGAPENSDGGLSAGHVRIYKWTGNAWVQKGLDMDGEAERDRYGYAVSMPDSNTVAIGAYFNDGNGAEAGHVRIFEWNGIAWIQKGIDIDGEASPDWSGASVSMPDANTVAIGAFRNDGNGSDAGHVRVFAWNGLAWAQKGVDIDGEASPDWSGYSVTMPNANTVAIGANLNDGNGPDAGHVRIFAWNGSTWTQIGLDIDGEAAGDVSGCAVSMPNATTIAIGAFENGDAAGHVRVYSLTGVGIQENDFGDALKIFPNPTQGELSIDLGASFTKVSVDVCNTHGQEVFRKSFRSKNLLQFYIPGEAGIYLINISAGDKRAVLKVIKE